MLQTYLCAEINEQKDTLEHLADTSIGCQGREVTVCVPSISLAPLLSNTAVLGTVLLSVLTALLWVC